MKYDQLREKALANFELLLDYWGIEFRLIGDNEYDFLNPTRNDTNFGACRFNLDKGRGADFAGTSFNRDDYARLGIGFSSDDFSGITSNGETSRVGFDIIGLAQRLHAGSSYKHGAEILKSNLAIIENNPGFIRPSRDAAERRREKQQQANTRLINYAHKIWQACKDINVEGSLAQVYFKSRGLNDVQEETIRFHPAIRNAELKQAIPSILFKVQRSPGDELSAIHRIYLTQKGRKANVASPKMALARISGSAIWFGNPSHQLAIAEGPENALTARYCYNFGFVCSSISAANFSTLTIPKYVKELVLLPDPDNAGLNSYKKAVASYKAQGIKKIQKAMLDWAQLDNIANG